MDLSSSQIKEFHEKILSWYDQHQRELPWRQTRDPYRILVSEVMSQQTQLSRVVPKYEAWLKRFPTVADLASASVSEVLRYWSGLGYNRRALHLQKAAQIIVKEQGGKFPPSLTELQKLPGLGKYTASAVMCFAFNAQIPVIDTNIRKVILTQFSQNHPEQSEGFPKEDSGVVSLPRMTEKEIEAIAWQILPIGKAYEWNQALMDYSALMLKKKKIPIIKQSHFLSSNRYFRGQTVKLLLDVKHISFSGLLDFFAERNPIERERLDEILEQMQKDGLIVYKAQTVSLSEV